MASKTLRFPRHERIDDMTREDDCLFCKIVAGDIPSEIVYEDDRVLAFKDISPMMPVHVLVIPKEHYSSIDADIAPEDASALMEAVSKVAHDQGIAESGYRVITNVGDDACQSVHHLHLHVLGGEKMNDGDPSVR